MTSAQVVETPVITTDNTTLTRTVKVRYYMLPPGSNHLLEDLTLFGVESKAIIIFI